MSEKLLKKEKESGEKLSEEEINFINDGKQIPLETYYYGSKKGSDTAKNSVPFTFNVKVSLEIFCFFYIG